MDKKLFTVLETLIITFVFSVFALLVLLNNSSGTHLQSSCENCTRSEKFFYRGLFPNNSETTFCVWSSSQLPSNGFIYGRACTITDCELIEIPRYFPTGIECNIDHPLHKF